MALTFGSRGFQKLTNPSTGQTYLIDRATGHRSVVGTGSASTSSKKKNTSWVDDGTVKYNIKGKTYSVKPASQGGYMQAYTQYAKDKAASKKQYEKGFANDTAYLKNTLASNNATTNANYDNSARQAYVDYMRKQKALPSQLQTLGVNGGATESALLNLYNNYGSSHAANEQQRNADLTANEQAYQDAYNALAKERREWLMDYTDDLAAQKQTAINNQINEYNNEITRFSSSVAQYPTTQKGYEKYQKWLKKLEKSKDPLKSVKMALVRQQMATQFPNGLEGIQGASGSGGSGGGGGSRRRYGGSRRSGGGSSSSSSNDSGSGSNSGLPDFSGVNKSVASALRKAVGKKTTTKKGDTYTRTKKNRLRGR